MGNFIIFVVTLFVIVARSSSSIDRNDVFVNYKEESTNNIACRDGNTNCHSWAEENECHLNPDFMRKSCPVSCKVCKPVLQFQDSFLWELIVITTKHGKIRIQPLFDKAPKTCALVLDLAHSGNCAGCNFYRNEAIPPMGSSGPPYGLLQGSLVGLLEPPPVEGVPQEMRRGHVAMIPGTTEFFLNLVDHPGWGSSMTIWGIVEDLAAAERIIEAEPYHNVSHDVYGTVMRMLDITVSFQLGYEGRQSNAAGGTI